MGFENMKKIFCLLICLILGVSVLSACTDKEKNPEIKTEDTSNLESEEKGYILKGEYLDEYKNLEVSEESKFFGTAIVNVRPKEYRDFDIPVISMESENANLVMTLMHLDSSWLEEYAISVSQSSTRAYTVAVLKAKQGMEGNVASAVTERLNDLNRGMKNYPDQMYFVENAVIEQIGNYLLVIVCDNADKVFNEFTEIMESTDLADLDVVPMLTEEERLEIENEALEVEIEKLESEIDDVIITPVEEPIEENETTVETTENEE